MIGDREPGQGLPMAPTITELEALTIMFSLLVFALFTLTGMLTENGNGPLNLHSALRSSRYSGNIKCDLFFTHVVLLSPG